MLLYFIHRKTEIQDLKGVKFLVQKKSIPEARSVKPCSESTKCLKILANGTRNEMLISPRFHSSLLHTVKQAASRLRTFNQVWTNGDPKLKVTLLKASYQLPCISRHVWVWERVINRMRNWMRGDFCLSTATNFGNELTLVMFLCDHINKKPALGCIFAKHF